MPDTTNLDDALYTVNDHRDALNALNRLTADANHR